MLVHCICYDCNQVGPVYKWHLSELVLVTREWSVLSFQALSNYFLGQAALLALTRNGHIEGFEPSKKIYYFKRYFNYYCYLCIKLLLLLLLLYILLLLL